MNIWRYFCCDISWKLGSHCFVLFCFGSLKSLGMTGVFESGFSLALGYASEYCINTYGGYGPMFISMLSDPGEIWDEYFVVDGQFPSLEKLQEYDGFVVTGSRHDAHANEVWIEKLCGLLQRIHEMKKKSLCVCFGHQVYTHHLIFSLLHKLHLNISRTSRPGCCHYF